MIIPAVSVAMCWSIVHNLEAENCVYLYGGKAPSLTCDTSQVHGIDCSGFTRYELARATAQAFILPDGSLEQNDWYAQNGNAPVNYYDIGKYGYGRLFHAFYINRAGIGHTWLVDGTLGKSLESHGHAGPSSRAWNDSVLLNIVTHCYELPVAA